MPMDTRTPDRIGTPTQLRVERLDDAIGVGTGTPRLSWQVPHAPQGWTVVEAQAESTAADGSIESAAIGQRGVVESWPFRPLRSGEGRRIRVRVRGIDHLWTEWSDPLDVEAGLLDDADWRTSFIAAPLGGEQPRRSGAPASTGNCLSERPCEIGTPSQYQPRTPRDRDRRRTHRRRSALAGLDVLRPPSALHHARRDGTFKRGIERGWGLEGRGRHLARRRLVSGPTRVE